MEKAASSVATPWFRAVIISVVVNIVIFWLGDVSNIIDTSIKANGQEVGYLAVVVSTLVGSIGAYLVYLLIGKLAKRNPNQVFRIVALVFFLLSLGSPSSFVGATALHMFMFMLMHLVVAWQMVKALTGSVMPPAKAA
jgi:hypothetical protein